MLSRLLALLVLCGAIGVSGQDAPTPASYTFGLEHVAVHGRITGVVDGDTDQRADPLQTTDQGPYRFY